MDYIETIKNQVEIAVTPRKTGVRATLLSTWSPRQNVSVFVTAGIPIAESIDDSLDTLTFTIRNYFTRKLFRPFDLVEFSVFGGDGNTDASYSMVVLSDNARMLSRMSQTYEHIVTCIELTKILEKIKIFNINLTNPQDTLLDQLKKALNNADPPIRKGGGVLHTNRFSVSEELTRLLEGVPGEDFRFGNTDLRTVLDSILSKVNCRVCVTKIDLADKNISNIEIGYRSMRAVKTVNPVWDRAHAGEIVGEEFTVHGQDVAGTIVSRGYNTIPNEPLTFTDIFKSKEYQRTTSNHCAILPFPVSEKGIVHFNIMVPFDMTVSLASGETLTGIKVDFPIDISSRLLPDEQYAVLSEEEQREYLPYTIGSDTIGVGDSYQEFLGWEVAKLQRILHDCASPPSLEELKRQHPNYQDAVGASYSGLMLSDDLASEWCPFNRPFTVSYYPLIDIVSAISKPGTYDEDDLLLGLQDSQSEQTLDMERQGRKLQSLIGRIGNDEYFIDVQADRFSTLLPLMSKIDLPVDRNGYTDNGYVLYKRECGIYDGFVKCRYYFSKNYNAVQEAAGVRREKHLYDIPLESDECPLIIKSYLVFSTSRPASMAMDACAFAYNAIQTLVGRNIGRRYNSLFEDERNGTGKINHLLFRTVLHDKNTWLPGEGKVFMLPTVNYAQGKTMNFVARTLDNFSVEYKRGGYEFSLFGDKGFRVLYAPYVGTDEAHAGEFSAVECKFAYEYGALAASSDGGAIAEFFKDSPIFSVSDSSAHFDFAEDDFIEIGYFKDRTQRPLFCKIVECVPREEDYGKLIVGTAFCRDNNLVKENGEGLMGLRLVTSDRDTVDDSDVRLYGWDDAGPVTEHFEAVSQIENVLMRHKGTLPGIKAWAIVNGAGEIYLACNGDLCDIYVSVSDTPK